MDFPKLNIHLAGGHVYKFISFFSMIVWENASKICRPGNRLKTLSFGKKKKEKEKEKATAYLLI